MLKSEGSGAKANYWELCKLCIYIARRQSGCSVSVLGGSREGTELVCECVL